mmetsp:Transcript_30097/g.96129  ORF Transcript_30097/g.96129 Transcript_30097/m.96129 type:complete len:297 (+) Transcript_30097:282-1172(+)
MVVVCTWNRRWGARRHHGAPQRDAVRRGARTSGRGEWTLCRVVKSGVRRNKTKRRIERRQTPGRRSASEQARRSPYPTYQDEMRICSPWQRERRGERGNESTAPATAARPSPQAPQDRRTSGAHMAADMAQECRRRGRRQAAPSCPDSQTRRRGVERSRDRPRSPEIGPRSARDRPRSVDLVVAPSAAPHLLLVRRRLHGDLGGGRRRRPCRRVEHAARRYLHRHRRHRLGRRAPSWHVELCEPRPLGLVFARQRVARGVDAGVAILFEGDEALRLCRNLRHRGGGGAPSRRIEPR